MKKRGQASYFIILGILVLIAVALLSYHLMSNYSFVESEFFPERLDSITNYVSKCAEITGKEAISLLAERGGYIYMPEYMASDAYSYINLDPNGIAQVPYWYYLGRTRAPTPDDISFQLSRYVEENIASCTGNFEVFKKKFDIEIKGDPSAYVTLFKEHAEVTLDYPIEIIEKAGKQVYRKRQFAATINTRLKQMYDLAVELLENENYDLFLENVTLDLMAANSNIPFTRLEFDCTPKRWFVNDIEDTVQQTLYYNLPRIRVMNTDYFPFRESDEVYEEFKSYTMEDIYKGKKPSGTPPLDAYEYNHFRWFPSLKQYDGLVAGVRYLPEWGMNLKAYPSDNGILSSTMQKGSAKYLRFLCINFNHFTYDVTYPVEIYIYDDTSLDGEGLKFRFMTPVMINHNSPDRRDTGVSIYKSEKLAKDYCDQLGDEKYDIIAKGIVGEYTDMEIDEVDITFDCLKFECYLGKTHADGGRYRLSSYVPENCRNGYIVASKDGYLQTTKQLAPENLIGNTLTVDMKKLKKMNVSVLKHKSIALESTSELRTWDSVLLNLKSPENDYEVYAQITDNSSTAIELIDDEAFYEVELLLVDTMDDVLYGGYKANFTIDLNTILNSDTITFHVVEKLPKPMSDEEYAELVEYLYEDEAYKRQLEPDLTYEGVKEEWY